MSNTLTTGDRSSGLVCRQKRLNRYKPGDEGHLRHFPAGRVLHPTHAGDGGIFH